MIARRGSASSEGSMSSQGSVQSQVFAGSAQDYDDLTHTQRTHHVVRTAEGHFKIMSLGAPSAEGLKNAAELVYFKLPIELAEMVVDRVTKSGFPGAAEWKETSQVEEAADDLFGRMELAAREMREEHGQTTESFEAVAAAVRKRAVEGLIKSTTFSIRSPRFPTSTNPTRLPFASGLSIHAKHIHHVEMLLSVGQGDGPTEAYPLDLFAVQDNISNLKTWLPNLKSVVIEVKKLGCGQVRARLTASGGQVHTTMREEITKLVEAFKVLDCGEKLICYLHRIQYRGDEVGMQGAELDEVVEAVMASEDAGLQGVPGEGRLKKPAMVMRI